MFGSDSTIFVDPARCIGCRTCEAACRECDGHRGVSVVSVDVVHRGFSVASQPSLCMHCEDPAAPCARVCPVDAIPVAADGVVGQVQAWCIGCLACVDACPFGVLLVDPGWQLLVKCDLCQDRTERRLFPLCAAACPTQALWYGAVKSFQAGRNGWPADTTVFGEQPVRTRVRQVFPAPSRVLEVAIVPEADLTGLEQTSHAADEPWACDVRRGAF